MKGVGAYHDGVPRLTTSDRHTMIIIHESRKELLKAEFRKDDKLAPRSYASISAIPIPGKNQRRISTLWMDRCQIGRPLLCIR